MLVPGERLLGEGAEKTPRPRRPSHERATERKRVWVYEIGVWLQREPRPPYLFLRA